jgi:hypothetical protein
MIFNAKNRKVVEKVWAIVSILAIVGMLAFSIIAIL